jgi:hypothetical protein
MNPTNPGPVRMNVNASDLEPFVCSCGSTLFKPVAMILKNKALLGNSPPMVQQVFACLKCEKLLNETVPPDFRKPVIAVDTTVVLKDSSTGA